MEVAIGFLFELVKISVQSALYSYVILLLFGAFFSKKIKPKPWLLLTVLIVICMFSYMNTHWGEHGLGDSKRIPLPNNKEISQMNGNYAYIAIGEYQTLPIDEFAIKDNYLIGLTGNDAIEKHPPFFSWNIENNQVIFYDTKNALDSISEFKNVEFKSFHKHYSEYWGGWRFWVLP